MSAITIDVTPNIAWFKNVPVEFRIQFLKNVSERLEKDFGGPVNIFTDYTLFEPLDKD